MSSHAALKFCDQCNWVYEAWVTHKLLFDENPDPARNIGKCTAFTSRLSHITQEYVIQQIAKLHDPAIQGNHLNLTIDYMVHFGDWGERADRINEICRALSDLWEFLRPARNKILAHSDMETLMADASIGAFPEGSDDAYFDALQTLVNEVHDKWVGGPRPFNDLAKVDVREFLSLLENTLKKA